LPELSVPEFTDAAKEIPQEALGSLTFHLHRPNSQCVLIHCPQQPNENKLELAVRATGAAAQFIEN
jgi:hypothetical protein